MELQRQPHGRPLEPDDPSELLRRVLGQRGWTECGRPGRRPGGVLAVSVLCRQGAGRRRTRHPGGRRRGAGDRRGEPAEHLPRRQRVRLPHGWQPVRPVFAVRVQRRLLLHPDQLRVGRVSSEDGPADDRLLFNRRRQREAAILVAGAPLESRYLTQPTTRHGSPLLPPCAREQKKGSGIYRDFQGQLGCRRLCRGQIHRPPLPRAGATGTSNPDHETRLARRSVHTGCHLAPDASRLLGTPPAPAEIITNTGENGSEPGAIPECEHQQDWVAERAVSSEPVSPRIWASARRVLHPRLCPRAH